MTLKRYKPPDNKIERQIIIGMITSTRFLKEVQMMYRENALQESYIKTIAKWCLEYHDKYNKAPGKDIENIFRGYKKSTLSPDESDLIEDFLYKVSEEYKGYDGQNLNIDSLSDNTELHFRIESVKNFIKKIDQAILGGRIDEAEEMIGSFTRITKEETKGIDPYRDREKIKESLSPKETGDALFDLPGDFGYLVGQPERGMLLAVVGSTGIGKTWWLQFLSELSFFAGYNTCFISMEMSEKQMIRRYHHSTTARPTEKHAGNILIPVFDCLKNQKNICNKAKRICDVGLGLIEHGEDIEKPLFEEANQYYIPCTICRDKLLNNSFEVATWFKQVKRGELTPEEALRKQKVLSETLYKRSGKFKLLEFPSGTLTTKMLETHLYNLEFYEDFIPDVIITDYADKMQSSHKREYRHQLNEIWEWHKGIAQKKHILMITGSQSNTSRTGADIKQGDWAESIGKSNLVDIAFSLNQTPIEKQEGIMRIGIMKQRHDDFNVMGEAMVLQQYKIGKPYLDSYFKGNIFQKYKKRRK